METKICPRCKCEELTDCFIGEFCDACYNDFTHNYEYLKRLSERLRPNKNNIRLSPIYAKIFTPRQIEAILDDYILQHRSSVNFFDFVCDVEEDIEVDALNGICCIEDADAKYDDLYFINVSNLNKTITSCKRGLGISENQKGE